MFSPNNELYVIQNAPIDPSWHNTLVNSFTSEQAYANFMIAKAKFSFPSCTVIRGAENGLRGVLRLPGTPEQYYDCNYIVYRNNAYGGKWFFAKLGEAVPRGTDCCFAPYEVDPWSWYWQAEFGQCLIEREHVNDDGIGQNRFPEQMETGNFITVEDGDCDPAEWDTQMGVVVIYNFGQADGAGSADYISTQTDLLGNVQAKFKFGNMSPIFQGGYLTDGIFSGSRYIFFPLESGDLEEAITILNDFIKMQVGDGMVNIIQGMYMAPAWAAARALAFPVNTETPIQFDVSSIGEMPKNIDGYTPKNNKLFSREFNYLAINNMHGEEVEYHYEDFENNVPVFKLVSTINGSCKVRLIPLNYRGVAENLTESIELGNFPKCSFQYSEFENEFNANRAMYDTKARQFNYNQQVRWLNQGIKIGDSSANLLGNVSSMKNQANSKEVDPYALSSAGVSTGTGLFSSAMETGYDEPGGENARREMEALFIPIEDHMRSPNTTFGTTDPNIPWSMGYRTFRFFKRQIRKEFAERIDKYLTMFGYAVHDIKTPNLTGRRNFNFVRAVGMVIENVPYIAEAQMNALFREGVRFWHQPANFMNYEADNSIIGGETT